MTRDGPASLQEEESLNEKLHESEKLITNLSETWENKLKKTGKNHLMTFLRNLKKKKSRKCSYYLWLFNIYIKSIQVITNIFQYVNENPTHLHIICLLWYCFPEALKQIWKTKGFYYILFWNAYTSRVFILLLVFLTYEWQCCKPPAHCSFQQSEFSRRGSKHWRRWASAYRLPA